ncbi:MAG: alpha/beta fold hydrolase [Peptoniphilaceae bacterium]|nr:alpha/beta fold hydrolase [Peptoniphilaceae bacterium]MDY6019508.1 alpha/beta fold hydrolase [Anaerococcus sp.]
MLHELKFKSFNERDDIYGFINVPASEIKGIIQLIHGFGEHSRRYLHMISKFVDKGYIVCYDDHVGHGKTAIENNSWGDFGNKGYTTMVEDEYSLYKKTIELYPNYKYFIFGHSMGSMIARQFMARYKDTIDAVTICGTTGTIEGSKEIKAYLEKLIEEGKADQANPDALGEIFKSFFVKIDEEIKLGNEWICHDKYVQLDHAKDPFNAFTKPTNNQSLLYFIQMLEEIDSKEWAEKVPKNLPIYNIAGDEDPVGNFGQGVKKVSTWLEETGHDVKTKIYKGYRHEIHNYPDIRDEVEDGIISFFDSKL